MKFGTKLGFLKETCKLGLKGMIRFMAPATAGRRGHAREAGGADDS